MSWQPIETAPKDGTWVLLFGGKAGEDWWEEKEVGGPPMRVAQWWPVTADNNYDGGWQFANYDSGYYGEVSGATHWMPLPSPPALFDAAIAELEGV
jgi:hypothetical protein